MGGDTVGNGDNGKTNRPDVVKDKQGHWGGLAGWRRWEKGKIGIQGESLKKKRK